MAGVIARQCRDSVSHGAVQLTTVQFSWSLTVLPVYGVCTAGVADSETDSLYSTEQVTVVLQFKLYGRRGCHGSAIQLAAA